MSLDSLKSLLPDYAKDLKLNLSSLASETALTQQQLAGAFIVSALASRQPQVIAAITDEF
ncbi:MAG TPA: alkyl hydroperoxide reductase, partial [Dongiaceae bacterium]